MQIVTRIQDMQNLAKNWKRQGKMIGFVPTMGCLHDGHLALIRYARSRSDKTVVSIFVNPLQFGPTEDFARYPRTWDADCQLCEEAQVDVVFYPTIEEMYPPNFSTFVEETVLSQPLCGTKRPGHFRGVTTVVTKLFNAVLPDIAVFGEKDAQQARVIKRMVRDLNFPIIIETVPTIREYDGLAMSSRNRYLSPDERQRALSIYQGLRLARERFIGGEINAEILEEIVRGSITAAGGTIDYVEVRDAENLEKINLITSPALLLVAARFGTTRLIDNILLQKESFVDGKR